MPPEMYGGTKHYSTVNATEVKLIRNTGIDEDADQRTHLGVDVSTTGRRRGQPVPTALRPESGLPVSCRDAPSPDKNDRDGLPKVQAAVPLTGRIPEQAQRNRVS